ncbi:MAG: tyrosine-type recombinase/integrase [Clostridia bacterium]
MAGTMRKRSNGKYYLEYMCEGERYSQTVKAKNDIEASKLLALFVTEVEKGTYLKQSNITFVEFAQLFIDKYATDNLSPTTLNDYKNRLNKYILEDFGRMKLTSIKRLHVQEFANKLVKEYNLSSKTAKNYIKLISSILNKAVEWDYLQINVADKVSIPKNLEKPKKKVILYSYDEVRLFIDALEKLEDKELQIAIYTSFYTGARRGEVLGLTFKDINFERKTIDFNKNKVATKGGITLKDIKNEKARLFYVPDSYIDKVKDYYNYLGKPKQDTNLFNMHPDTYSENFKQFLSDNNLRRINLKDLRALNESILVNQGLDVVSVAKRLGHLPSTATNYYLDQIPEEDKKASEILQNLF